MRWINLLTLFGLWMGSSLADLSGEFHFFDPRLLELGDSDLLYHLKKVKESERIIDFSKDLRHFTVFREREFLTEKTQRVLATVEYRSGWPFIAEVAVALSKRERKKRYPKFKDEFDPRLTQIWLEPDGLKKFQKKHDNFYRALVKELKRQCTAGKRRQQRKVDEWGEFVKRHYAAAETDWSEELKAELAIMVQLHARISDWAVIYERLPPQAGRSRRGKIVNTLMKTKSSYARFLVRKKGSNHEYKAVTCRLGSCDAANLFRSKEGEEGYHGIFYEPPIELVVEKITGVRLPRMVQPGELPKKTVIQTAQGEFEVLSVGTGEISEDRCWVLDLTKDKETNYRAFGNAWIAIQLFLADPEKPVESLIHKRSYAYIPQNQTGDFPTLETYQKLGLLEEVYPPVTVDWGHRKEKVIIFSYSPFRVAQIIRDPSIVRQVFKKVDPDILLNEFLALLSVQRKYGSPIFAEQARRGNFFTRRRIRKILKYLHTAREKSLLVASDKFKVSDAITGALREMPEIAKQPLYRNITAASFYEYLRLEYRDDAPAFRWKHIFRIALEDAGIDWREIEDYGALTYEQAAAAFRNIVFNYPEIDLNQKRFQDAKTEDLVMQAIFEVTGKIKRASSFVAEVNRLNRESGGWYGFFLEAGADPLKFQDFLSFTEEEVIRVVLGIIERKGEYIKHQVQKNPSEYQTVLYEVLPERPRRLCTVGRFLSGIQKLFGSYAALRKRHSKRVSQAEKNHAQGKVTQYARPTRKMTNGRSAFIRLDGLFSYFGSSRFQYAIKNHLGEIADQPGVPWMEASLDYLLRSNQPPLKVAKDPTGLSKLTQELQQQGHSDLSEKELTGLLEEMNLAWVRLPRGRVGKVKVYTKPRIRWVLKTLHERWEKEGAPLPESAEAFSRSLGVTQFLRSLPAFEPTITARSFVQQACREYAEGADERQTFKEVLIDAEIDWRQYYPFRELTLLEIIQVIRYLHRHHPDIELKSTHIQKLSVDDFGEITWKVVRARMAGARFRNMARAAAGSWQRAIFIAGYDPAELSRSDYIADKETLLLRELVAGLAEQTQHSVAALSLADTILSYLIQTKTSAQSLLESPSELESLCATFSELLQKPVTLSEVRPILASFSHRIDVYTRSGLRCQDHLARVDDLGGK